MLLQIELHNVTIQQHCSAKCTRWMGCLSTARRCGLERDNNPYSRHNILKRTDHIAIAIFFWTDWRDVIAIWCPIPSCNKLLKRPTIIFAGWAVCNWEHDICEAVIIVAQDVQPCSEAMFSLSKDENLNKLSYWWSRMTIHTDLYVLKWMIYMNLCGW